MLALSKYLPGRRLPINPRLGCCRITTPDIQTIRYGTRIAPILSFGQAWAIFLVHDYLKIARNRRLYASRNRNPHCDTRVSRGIASRAGSRTGPRTNCDIFSPRRPTWQSFLRLCRRANTFSALPDQSILDIGSGEYHFAMAPGIPRKIQRHKQPQSERCERNVAAL